MSQIEIEKLSQTGLTYLATEPNELARFLASSGYDPDGLRAALGTDELATALMDYFAHNEAALLDMCAKSGIGAAKFMALWHKNNRTM